MLEDQFVSERPMGLEGGFSIGKAFGFFLIVAGVCVLGWVLSTVVNVFNDPAELTRFVEVLPSDIDIDGTLGDQPVKITIPLGSVVYVIPLILLGIAAGIGKVLIGGGVKLADSSIVQFKRRIAEMQNRVIQKINAVKDAIEK